MWLLWRRLGTEGYYAGLDKQFGSLQQNINVLEDGKRRRDQVWSNVRSRFAAGFMAIYMIILAYAAWVMQQPMGKYSSTGHAKRVAPAFIAPILAYAVYRVTDRLRTLFDQRADAQIKRLKEKLRKMVAELKDSTRYQRTQALIEKYDPEHQQKMTAAAATRGGGAALTPEERKLNMQLGNGSDVPENAVNSRGLVTSSSGRKLADRATSAAATAVTGAGAALSSALGQLVGSAAKNLIGDEPMMIEMLKQAQTQAKELERENAELRQLLGWPQRASNNNIVATLGGGGASGAGAGGGGGAIRGGTGDFAFGSPVSQNPEPDALIESPRALSPLPASLPKKENKNDSVIEKEDKEEEREGDDATPPTAGNSGGGPRSRRRS